MESELQRFPDSPEETWAVSDSQESPAMNHTVKTFGGKEFILKESEDKSSFSVLITKDHAKQIPLFHQDASRPFEFVVILKPADTDFTEPRASVRAVLPIPPSYDYRYHSIDIQEFEIKIHFPSVSILRDTIPGYRPQTRSQEQSHSPTSDVTMRTPPRYEPMVQFRVPRSKDLPVTPQAKKPDNEIPTRPRKSNVGNLKLFFDEEYDTGSPKPTQKRRRASKAVQPSRKAVALENLNKETKDVETRADLES